jgi:hypothetical protein
VLPINPAAATSEREYAAQDQQQPRQREVMVERHSLTGNQAQDEQRNRREKKGLESAQQDVGQRLAAIFLFRN